MLCNITRVHKHQFASYFSLKFHHKVCGTESTVCPLVESCFCGGIFGSELSLCASDVSLDVGVCVWEGGRAGGRFRCIGRAGLRGRAGLTVLLWLSWKRLHVNFLPFLELWGCELRIGQQLVNQCYFALPVLWGWRKRAVEGGHYRYSLLYTVVRMW